MSKKILLIDGHSILNRAYYGLPNLTNWEGLHTNAVYGFLNIMTKVLEEEKPEYLAVAFDLPYGMLIPKNVLLPYLTFPDNSFR